jgi:cytochrome b pre-mRNA-processing protein 3
VTFLRRIFGGKRNRELARPLYEASVAAARDPGWYRDGGVPDTIDGRFDMIIAMLGLVLLRLEREGEPGRKASVRLTECFIDDMEGGVREMGIGDLNVGKHVGRMMSALGGRLGAFREALGEGNDLEAPVRRNIFHESPPSPEAVRWVAERLARFHHGLNDAPMADILAGTIPNP